jgi:hypothetical protein
MVLSHVAGQDVLVGLVKDPFFAQPLDIDEVLGWNRPGEIEQIGVQERRATLDGVRHLDAVPEGGNHRAVKLVHAH